MRIFASSFAVKSKIGECITEMRGISCRILSITFSRSRTEAETELKSLSGDTAYLVELLEEFEQIFREKKIEKNMVDFDDVMHYASKILDDPMAAEEYREKFTYIFIDEFQDSNMLQEIIAGKICRENNLFMVGDVKYMAMEILVPAKKTARKYSFSPVTAIA